MSLVFLLPIVMAILMLSGEGVEGMNGKKGTGVPEWDYGKNGPSTWTANCDGKSQSPINIDTKSIKKAKKANLIRRHNYWVDTKGTYVIKNNGHALQIDLPKDTTYRLMKANQTYIPLQIHLHFDPLTGKGSEHTINKVKSCAEVHIVHANAKYTTKHDVMVNTDGLLVIGILVERVKKDGNREQELDFKFNPGKINKIHVRNKHNSFAMQVFAAAAELTSPGEHKSIPAFPLAWLFPRVQKNRAVDYINYKGSLTTPPCSQVVDWVVLTGQKLEINEQTAKTFEDVINSSGTPMSGNNRPVQALNKRKVYGVKGMFW